MERKEIYEKIKQAISSVLRREVDFTGITEDTDIIESLNLNSIVAIELVVRMETLFDIEIDDEDLSTDLFRTLKNIADYIEEKRALANE
ncbi:acyl carrier protein [Anaerocolumna jejuensis DSM 15929]|uniref:Acyl carrier protein n=1 Tax=Anaerocolumna jejuensis DSM 15929 TaxID=1121322 RepID=A0A1M6NX46_9FIRM|nr:acyl carrier protein [Anaerocolumna jejuensis]SHK00256.1 acyl carrier protein [Anaerocolumna jejuensis DSM 15929]